MNELKEAIHVFRDYHACPCCSNGKNVLNEAAIYAEESFTHRIFVCKDCNQEFKVPDSIKLNKPKEFKRREFRKPEGR